MTTEQINALLDRRAKALAAHNAEALAADYADDCVVESPSYGTLLGRAAVEKMYRQWFVTFPDTVLETVDLLVVGNRVVQTATMYGTDTGGFLGQVPTQKPYRVLVVLVFALDDRGIVHERRVYDIAGLLLQLATDLGVKPETARIYQATLERARLEQEMRMAAEIQRALLPETTYRGAGFEVSGASVPCRAIGGDFFDYFDLPAGIFGFALGDVTGKGPAAALLAAELQGIFAAHTYSGGTAAETVTRANKVLSRRVIESRFATVVYGMLSPAGDLTYCNAGHNPPVLVTREKVRRLDTGGLILGAFREACFEQETVQLDCGDILVVFSDGVTEAMNADGTEFGDDALLSCVATHRDLEPTALLQCVLDAVHEFSAGAAQFDDLTVLVLRYTGGQRLAA